VTEVFFFLFPFTGAPSLYLFHSKKLNPILPRLVSALIISFLVHSKTRAGVHPLHLHGMSFWVMAQGPAEAGAYDATTSGELKPLFVRDVAVVQASSYIVIRFTASNPGLWMFHCHIDFHLGACAVFQGRKKSVFFPRKRGARSLFKHFPLVLILILVFSLFSPNDKNTNKSINAMTVAGLGMVFSMLPAVSGAS
jgi:hypothetical protein